MTFDRRLSSREDCSVTVCDICLLKTVLKGICYTERRDNDLVLIAVPYQEAGGGME